MTNHRSVDRHVPRCLLGCGCAARPGSGVGGFRQNARMGMRYLIDETKAKGYVVVAVACPDDRVRELRTTVGSLVMSGQRSLHMKTESAARRKVIADVVASLCLDAWVVDASSGAGKEHERRARALTSLLMVTGADAQLVFDRDLTMERFDRRVLSAMPPHERPTHVHLERHRESLLALPDVIAWCWARGGEWRRRLSPLTIRVITA